MSPMQLAGWLRMAYLNRDHDGHERGLQLLQRATTIPDVRVCPALSADQLQKRRHELHAELAAVNAAIERGEREAALRQQRERDVFLATQAVQVGTMERT